MALSDQERLLQLGSAVSIDTLCQSEGITREEFDAWWKQIIVTRAATLQGSISDDVSATVSIQRDRHEVQFEFDNCYIKFHYLIRNRCSY